MPPKKLEDQQLLLTAEEKIENSEVKNSTLPEESQKILSRIIEISRI